LSDQRDANMGDGKEEASLLPKLKGRENYATWKFLAMNLLKHENLWHAVGGYPTEDKTDAATRARRDEKALSKLCLSVDVSCIPHVMKAGTAKEA